MRRIPVTVALFVAGWLPVFAASQQLLVNPGFDGGTSGWTADPAPGCAELRWLPEGVVEVSGDCDRVARGLGWRQEVPLSRIDHLRLAFTVEAEDLSGRADVVLTFRDGQGTVLWSTGAHALTGSFDPTTYHWALAVPAGSASVEVWAGAEIFESGSVRLDEVRLEAVPAGGFRTITVDCAGEAGEIRNLLGTNRSPFQDGADYGIQAAAAGIRWVRVHDEYRGCDMSQLFPDPDADPDDPASYDFSGVDRVVGDLVRAGYNVLFRIGESWNGPPSPRMDPDRFAQVAVNLVRHLNLGWADGHHYGIRYFEIWNEPNGGHTWDGTPEEYDALYVATATALKELDPQLLVGGPALAGFSSRAWVERFLTAVSAAGAPLDFFSWHTYHMGNPRNLADAQLTLRRLLDGRGFTATQLFPDEWNLSAGQGCPETNCTAYTVTAYSAAHTAAALVFLEDTDAPLSFRYRTDGYELFGLFGDGVTVPAYAPSGLAYRLLAAFDATPVRLPAEGGDDAGYAVMAGRSRGPDGTVHVLVADPGSADTGYRLVLEGCPETFSWEVRRIADPVPWTDPGDSAPLIASGNQDDLTAGALEIAMASPAVDLVTISPARRARHPAGRTSPRGGRTAASR